MKFIIDKEKYIDTKLVDEKEHLFLPLLIYNYTPECQFSKSWDDVTMMCRGLIVNRETREIVARPFKKFFNYEEHVAKGDTIPDEEPKVYPKMDGSLGILYWYDKTPYIATRGSFTSDQAQWATEFINRPGMFNWVKQCDGHNTYLFEIIYPENRIVVNYGSRKDLVLLAVIDTETGETLTEQLEETNFPFVTEYPFKSIEELKALNTPNEEGFVLYYPNADFRMKIKFEDYVKLHKVMTGLSQIGIWEMLRDGKNPIADPEIPDEMHEWIGSVVTDLIGKFFDIEEESRIGYLFAKELQDRKAQAEYIKKLRYPGITFSMLDGKDYKSAIWKMVRPRGQVTFRKDIDV